MPEKKSLQFHFDNENLKKFCRDHDLDYSLMLEKITVYFRNRMWIFREVLIASGKECNQAAGKADDRFNDKKALDLWIEKNCLSDSKTWFNFFGAGKNTAEHIPPMETRKKT